MGASAMVIVEPTKKELRRNVDGERNSKEHGELVMDVEAVGSA